MPAPEEPLRAPGLLLCEGPDDFAFFISMLADLTISRDIVDVERLDGRRQLHDRLNALPIRDASGRLRALGIVCDADDPDDGPAAFRRIRDDLRNTGYTAPTQAPEIASGPWGGGPSLSVGVYVMPDNLATGALEDLCLSVIDEDPTLPCVDEFLSCVSTTGNLVWREQVRSKARLNAWLASREDPTRRLGQAISAGVIPADARAFEPIRDFLARLAVAASTPEIESS
jgi:hypothetical protein